LLLELLSSFLLILETTTGTIIMINIITMTATTMLMMQIFFCNRKIINNYKSVDNSAKSKSYIFLEDRGVNGLFSEKPIIKHIFQSCLSTGYYKCI